MQNTTAYEVIVVGGSYAGLSAALALGRSLRRVLVIDSGLPCNRQTPHSHNFLTHDGHTPADIARAARQQVEMYKTVSFANDLATEAERTADGFILRSASGKSFKAQKLIFATGIKDIMSTLPGFAECWGISVLHCPYCHGYEVRDEVTGILANGELAFEYATLISHWTNQLTVYTNGKSTLSPQQAIELNGMGIAVVEKEIGKLVHDNGHLKYILFKDGSHVQLKALYARSPFEQHCQIPEQLGCELTEQGYLKADATQKTTVDGVYACGDNVTAMRTVANAVYMGTAAGMMLNKEMINEKIALSRPVAQ